MLFTFLLILHILVAFALVMSILLQSSQGGGMSSAFGGSGNQTLFGGRGAATFLSRATTYLGAGFLALSFVLAIVQTHRSGRAAASRNIIQETMMPKSSGSGAGDAAPQGSGGNTGQPVQEPDAGAPGDLPGGSPAPAGGPSGN
jgi:preprotein translocase subunit SecG